MLHGACKLFAAVAAERTQNITRKTFAVYAHKHRSFEICIFCNKRKMQGAAGNVFKGEHAELAVLGGHIRLSHKAYELLVAAPVFNKVGNGDHFYVMLYRYALELRHAGHGAVFVHYLAYDRRRIQSGKPCKVYR